jgi:hypothetical protein
MKMFGVFVVAAIGLFFSIVGPARADMLITSRSGPGGLNGTDHIDWGVLGPATPGMATIPNPSILSSAGGVSFTISEGTGNFSRLDQGSAPGVGPWYGNFAPGDHLLYSGGQSGYPGGGIGPLIIKSNGPLLIAAGAQIESNKPGPFTATITTFDAHGNPISTFTETGTSNELADNSAIFIGVLATTPFASVSFTTTVGNLANSDNNDFAINQFDFTPVSSAPEPTSLTLLGMGIVGLVGYHWRKRKQAV